MDIQKQFEAWYKDHHHKQIGSFDGEYYTNGYEHTLWVGWQAAKASAVLESNALLSASLDAIQKLGSGDFVLVPIVPSSRMVDAVRKCYEGEAYLPYSLYSEFINQAMIEAQEPSHD